MANYLIEFRFQGAAKGKIKRLIYEVNKKFRIRPKSRPIPHITIVAPFVTKNQRQLVRDFKDVCENQKIIKFKINGYGYFSNSRVVYIKIDPSKEMLRFREDLLKKLKKYCKLCTTDIFSFLGFKFNKKYSPHATIAMKLSPQKFNAVKNYVYRKREHSQNYILARVTLIKNKRILYEYDFILRRLLNRYQAKNRKIYSETIKRLKND